MAGRADTRSARHPDEGLSLLPMGIRGLHNAVEGRRRAPNASPRQHSGVGAPPARDTVKGRRLAPNASPRQYSGVGAPPARDHCQPDTLAVTRVLPVTYGEFVRVIHAYACATRTRCGGGHAYAGPPRTWWQVWAVHPVSAGSTASRKYSGRGVGSLSQSRVRTSQGGSSICMAALKSAVGDFSG